MLADALNWTSREKEIDRKIAGVTEKAAEVLYLGAVCLKRGAADIVALPRPAEMQCPPRS